MFDPASKWRAQLRALVPAPARELPPSAATPGGSARAGRVPWAELLRRVFATDVLSCPCGGRRSVVAVVVDDAMARTVLATLGLPCTPATLAPARDPPQAEWLARGCSVDLDARWSAECGCTATAARAGT